MADVAQLQIEISTIGVEAAQAGIKAVGEAGAKTDEREIMRFCKEYLSRYKCPRKVTFVQEITRDSRGRASGWK